MATSIPVSVLPTVIPSASLAAGNNSGNNSNNDNVNALPAGVTDEAELALLPPISMIPSLEPDMREAILDVLFEPSPELHAIAVDALLGKRKYASYEAMVERVGVSMRDLAWSTSEADLELLNKILGSHPRLGASTVESAQSAAEQAQLHNAPAQEANQLTVLNELYEAKFPGLRYVVFVNKRPRANIMADMQARIQRDDLAAERDEAIKAMCDIAVDRARRLLAP